MLRLILLAVLLAVAVGASAQPTALLLGWRVDGDDRRSSSYRSLLVYTEPDGAFRGQAGNGVLVPTREGLVRVGAKRSRYNAWDETFVWAAPLGALPAYAGIDPFNGEYCRGQRHQALQYVGPTHVAVETASSGYCEGTASPWEFETFSVLALDSLAGEGLDLPDVLGEDVFEAFWEGAEAYLGALPEARRFQYIPEPDPANWSLAHKRGRWVLVGRLESAEMGRSARPADFDVEGPLPQAFTGPVGSLAWERVLAAARDARDAFVSPAGTLVAIQRPLLLTIHPIQNGRIQPAVLGQPLPAGAVPISVQWIDARTAVRARQALRGEGSR